MLKRLLLPLALLLLTPLWACAQEETLWEAGKHYDLITPAIRTADPSKIEVTEFFWYGCSHCYNFEPMISQWKKTLPEDVVFKGSPAMWNEPMELHGKAFYAADVLGVLDTMHLVLFQAMNVDRKRLSSESEIAAEFEANGVSTADFSKAFSSFGVGSQMRQANANARAAKITGTPEIMVNGKYRVSSRKAGNHASMLKLVDHLIEKERTAAAS